MDFGSIHGPDVSNFSPSPHRMPTVSAAQALQDLKSAPSRCISTGLARLDDFLQSREPSSTLPIAGGVSKGDVTEIYGPPGVGKTALGIQLAVNALNAGDGVIWVDAAHTLCGTRLLQILSSTQSTSLQSTTSSSARQLPSPSDLLDNLMHFSTPTLAHLIALLSELTQDHPPINTSLMVIDSFSTLIANAFPRVDAMTIPKKPGAPNPSGRKFPILQYIINTLQKLAATRNIAVVILSQCVSKMRPGAGAILVPAINTTAWEQGLGARIALFRDWSWDDEDGKSVGDVRLAQTMKANGIALQHRGKALAAFAIYESGLSSLIVPEISTFSSSHKSITQVNSNTGQRAVSIPPETAGQKRKISQTDLEVPDSDAEDDEDYGWADEDEGDVPAMPPQWQGSEDILVPGVGELQNDERAEEEERETEWERDKDRLQDDHGDKSRRGDRSSFAREIVEDSEDELA